MSKTIFIADLHLDKHYPNAVKTFLSYLHKLATQNVDALYILGDLFEYWLGDDCLDKTATDIAKGLSNFNKNTDIPIYFIHGNRDFLLGKKYANQCQMQILAECVEINLYGVKTLLLHGDKLCTDDIDYMKYRRRVRTSKWQAKILQLPVWLRKLKALQMRYLSKKANKSKNYDIMDVSQNTVEKLLYESDSEQIIHGHTHRPAIHKFMLNGKMIKRCVVGDWYEQGSILEVSKDEHKLVTLPFAK